MPKTTRINIPAGESDVIALANSIKTKHQSDGNSSPISGLEWVIIGPKIDQAVALDDEIQQLEKQVEQLIQQRSRLTPDIREFVRSSRDVLQGIYRATMRKLMDWGFSVDDTPKAPKKNTAKTPNT